MNRFVLRAIALVVSVIACAPAQAQCEPEWFTNVSQPGLDGPAWASAVFDEGNGNGPALYVGGAFLYAGNVLTHGLARWDGKMWSDVYGFNFGSTYAINAYDHTKLYVGGDLHVGFQNVSFPLASLLYGTMNWVGEGNNPPPGYPNKVYALRTFDADGPGGASELVVGGEFGLYALGGNGVPIDGKGAPAVVLSLAVQSGLLPVLYAGGYGDTNIAQYDRLHGFRPLASGVNGPINVLTIFDDGSGPALFAGGDFTDAGGISVHSIAKWNGESWSDVGGGIHGGLLAGVYSLTVFDDGNGPALYVGGNFDSAGNQTAANIARWDGANWSALGDGVTGDGATVLTMTPFKQGKTEFLYVAGWFDDAGGQPASNIARWGCSQEKVCYPDCDGNGALDLFDFLCFQNKFIAGDAYADCTADGALDLFDFLCFVNAFNAGCP